MTVARYEKCISIGAKLGMDAETRLLIEIGTLALHPVVETVISESEFRGIVCPVCKGTKDQGHTSECVWGDFVGIINREMDDQ